MKPEKTLANFIKTTKTALSLAWKASPTLTFFYFLVFGVSGVIPAITIWASKKIIDCLVLTHGSLNDPNFYKALSYLGIAAGSAILANALSTIRFLLHNRILDILTRYAQLTLINKSLELDISFFESADFFNHYEKVRQQIEDRFPRTVGDIAELFRVTIEVISVASILVSVNWILLPVILIVNIPTLLWGMQFSRGKHRMVASRIPEAKMASYITSISTDKETVKEVKLFNLGNYLLNKYTQYFDRVLAENWKISKKQFMGSFITTFIADAAYYGFYLFTISQVFLNKLSIGGIVLYTASFTRASSSLGGMLRFINSLYENALYLNDFAIFINLKPVLVEAKNPIELKKIIKINFNHVWFKYKQDLPYVFEDISFEVKENENIAIVGQNGAGKTTLIKLLMRFYDVTQGNILINDIDIKEYSLASLWQQVGTIFQDFVKYQLTVRENIAFGQIEKLDNMDEVIAASKKAEADSIIEKLENKYEAVLGTRFEGGTDLSLGQWQRIALARAFIRNSSVIILDEPTASLDAKAEYEIFKKFKELTQGRISFLISHRFSTVRLADRIMVIEHGRLIENGSHKELLELGGKYAEMFNLQAEGYK